MAEQDPRAFYRSPGPMTDPGRHASALDGLPSGVGDLVRVVQGLIVHPFWQESYGIELDEARQGEVQIRRLEAKLERILELDPSPLTVSRPADRRLVGNCRDFSLMMVAFLRRQGVPARARCGFGAYFQSGLFLDHWVAEYWSDAKQKWVMVDAQLDEVQRRALGIQFDPLDVPSDAFVVAGRAWQLAREGKLDPEKCGIFDMHGMWFIRGNVVRDFLAVSGVEILPWDHGFGVLGDEPAREPDEDRRFVDRLAELALAGDERLEERQTLFAREPGLSVPAEWLSEERAVPPSHLTAGGRQIG